MKLLVTGAAGFIGSHLVRLALAEGHTVSAIVRSGTDHWRLRDIASRLNLIEHDLADLSAIGQRLAADGPPDLCLHLAWRGWSGSSATVEDNVTSLGVSLEFMRLMASIGCLRFVAAGTCFEYDTSVPCLSEDAPVQPHDLYGTCKSALLHVAEQFARVTKMEVVWPRIFYSYGPYEDRRRLVPSIVLALLRGMPAATTRGEQVRDYLHVEDVAGAIWAVAASRFVGVVNIASGTPITLASLIREIGDLMGRADLVRLGALPYRESEPMTIRADASRLRNEIGWSPKFDLPGGLRQTIEWWRSREAAGPK